LSNLGFAGCSAPMGSGGSVSIRSYKIRNNLALTFNNIQIQSSYAGWSGGGVSVILEAASSSNILQIADFHCSDCSSSGSKAWNGDGGGAFYYRSMASTSGSTISVNNFVATSAVSAGFGGGLAIVHDSFDSGMITLNTISCTSCTALQAGAVGLLFTSSLTNSAIYLQNAALASCSALEE